MTAAAPLDPATIERARAVRVEDALARRGFVQALRGRSGKLDGRVRAAAGPIGSPSTSRSSSSTVAAAVAKAETR